MGQEKNFENKVKKFLKDSGCYFIKYWAGAEFTKSGVPDILCCCNGRFLGIELKAPTGKPSELQIYNLKKINDSGGFAILLYPKNFEKFKDFIQLVNWDEYSMYKIYRELRDGWLNASKSQQG